MRRRFFWETTRLLMECVECIYIERDMYILEGKGKEKGKTRKTRRKLPLISQWDRGRVIDTPRDDRYNVESISPKHHEGSKNFMGHGLEGGKCSLKNRLALEKGNTPFVPVLAWKFSATRLEFLLSFLLESLSLLSRESQILFFP